MIIKHLTDHLIVNSPTCGEVREILKHADYGSLGVAVCMDIKQTEGHFHQTFDEIYFVLDGQISLEIYDPHTKKSSIHLLKANELCVISKGLHHKILQTSDNNRLCVISCPPFHSDDEHPSNVI